VVNGASFAGGAAVAPGSIVSVFGSDLALLTERAGATPLPNSLAGTSLTINSRPRLPVSATIGGRAAEVLFAGLTPGYIGLLQVNLRVAALGSGDYAVVVTIGGVTSNAAMLTVSAN
jgi:hypothetical protein